MKKFKWTIMTLAILLSIGGAFGTRLRQPDCRSYPQYYNNGNSMVAAGIIGWDYYCANQDGPNICTYALISGSYVACQRGDYTFANGLGKAKLLKAPVKTK